MVDSIKRYPSHTRNCPSVRRMGPAELAMVNIESPTVRTSSGESCDDSRDTPLGAPAMAGTRPDDVDRIHAAAGNTHAKDMLYDQKSSSPPLSANAEDAATEPITEAAIDMHITEVHHRSELNQTTVTRQHEPTTNMATELDTHRRATFTIVRGADSNRRQTLYAQQPDGVTGLTGTLTPLQLELLEKLRSVTTSQGIENLSRISTRLVEAATESRHGNGQPARQQRPR